MPVTLSPIMTFVRPVQVEKADSPMVVTPSGIVTFVKPVQEYNAPSPMLVTLLPMMRLFRL